MLLFDESAALPDAVAIDLRTPADFEARLPMLTAVAAAGEARRRPGGAAVCNGGVAERTCPIHRGRQIVPWLLAVFMWSFAMLLAAGTIEPQDCGRCSRAAVAEPCGLRAGHRGGPAVPVQDACPAMLEAEGAVEEVDLRDASFRWACCATADAVFAVPLAGRVRAGSAAAETALAAAAADVSRLCRRLL